MANIKKGARAYYADTDYKRDGMTEAYGKIDSLPAIPTPEESDAGKVIKVNDSGVYGLSDDLHTPVAANPEGTPTAELNTITIGDTIYKVNDSRVTKILELRFTINNGGAYVTKMPIVSFVNEYGEAAQVPAYTGACDKPLQYGSLSLNGDAGVVTQNLPAIITFTFNAEFNIEDFANIKLENSGLFPGDIAKNIKLEYSVNGADWLEIFDKVSIDWTNTVHIYDMSTGEETTTTPAIPTPTTTDAGKFLGVDNNGAWELDNIPSELPAVTSADAGKVLSVDNNGDWGLGDRDVFYVDATIDSTSTPTKITLNGMTRTDLINSAALYKEHIIVAKTADEKSSLFFHQFRDNNDPVQRSLNFFSFGINHGSVDRIYSCFVLPSPTSSEINILTKTLA